MTVFFAAIAVITVFAPPLANQIGVGRTVILACVLLGLDNVVFAASPLFSGLLLGRVLVGLGAGYEDIRIRDLPDELAHDWLAGVLLLTSASLPATTASNQQAKGEHERGGDGATYREVCWSQSL